MSSIDAARRPISAQPAGRHRRREIAAADAVRGLGQARRAARRCAARRRRRRAPRGRRSARASSDEPPHQAEPRLERGDVGISVSRKPATRPSGPRSAPHRRVERRARRAVWPRAARRAGGARAAAASGRRGRRSPAPRRRSARSRRSPRPAATRSCASRSLAATTTYARSRSERRGGRQLADLPTRDAARLQAGACALRDLGPVDGGPAAATTRRRAARRPRSVRRSTGTARDRRQLAKRRRGEQVRRRLALGEQRASASPARSPWPAMPRSALSRRDAHALERLLVGEAAKQRRRRPSQSRHRDQARARR